MTRTDLIPVGILHGPHGIRGQIRYQSYSGNLAALNAAKEVVLRHPNGREAVVTVSRVVQHGSKLLLTLREVTSIDQAELLVGAELLLRRDQFPEPAEDEYYWQDLIGMQVVTASGDAIGILTDIMETGANDVYTVRQEGSGKEILIPAIATVVVAVDVAARCMTIAPLEGMLDL